MPKQLKFRISSELKTLIGKELITDDYIAIFELVKNAYDANANNVTVIFQNVENDGEKAKIFIKDDGDGMSDIDLEKKWLFVGYSEKAQLHEDLKRKGYRDEIKKRRIFAGAKGIGRFSCDKLGATLKIYTKKLTDDFFHLLDVDWRKFETKPEDEFQTIAVDYERQNKIDVGILTNNFSKGTILEISSLRSPWDRKKILRLKRHLQRLINPMKIGEQEFTIELKADEYKKDDENNRKKGDYEVVNGQIHNIVLERLDLKTTNIECSIDEDGKEIRTELWDKGNFVFSLVEKNEYPELQNVLIKLFFLNKQAKQSFHRIMGIRSVGYGSVFFYKNGIKINPCGDFGDDWLGLDRRKTQEVWRVFGTRDVLGRIEVNGYQPGFTEVSSRDGGVIKTTELEKLKLFFRKKALRRLERYVIEGLGWDSEPRDSKSSRLDSLDVIKKILGQKIDPDTHIEFNKDLLEIYEEKQIEKTPEIIKNIKSLKKFVPEKKDRDYIDNQLKTVSKSFTTIQAHQKELTRELRLTEKQNIFLRQITDEEKEDIIRLQHLIKIATSKIVSNLMNLKDDLDRSKNISNEELLNVIDRILVQTSLISSMVLYATKASFNVKKAKTRKDMVEFIKQYIDNVYGERYRTAIRKRGITINVMPEKGLVFEHKFRPLDIVMIIANLLDNSRKAKAKNVDVLINKITDDLIEIRVKDDGEGINKNDYKKIFELGYSTTDGSGIGLYSIKKIIEDNNWKISVNESIDKGSEFILEVKR